MTAASSDSEAVKLSELVALMSLGADLGLGQPMEHALRQCLMALQIGELLDFDEEQLLRRYAAAGGRLFACPVCFNAKQLDKGDLLANAEVAGAGPMFDWIGDEGATTLSY